MQFVDDKLSSEHIFLRLALFLLILLLLLPSSSSFCSTLTKGRQLPNQLQLHSEKLKALCRREPRAKEIIERIENKLLSKEVDTRNAPILKRTEDAMNQIIMTANFLSEEHLADAVDFLESLAGPIKTLSKQELSALQERYKKLCTKLDDQIFIRDFESVLARHDRFIHHTALSLWNHKEITDELQAMERLIESAPEIPYGRLEFLRGFQGIRLAAPKAGCYVGLSPQEEMYLSRNRLSVAALEESTTCQVRLDAANLVIKDKDDKFTNLDDANRPSVGLPFSPPLTLWLKSRLLEGHLVAINFCLGEDRENNSQGSLTTSATKQSLPREVISVADILEGKLDDYFKFNFKLLASTKAATMVGLLNNFDRLTVATAFGANGRTPYYFLSDPKLRSLSEDKQEIEVAKSLRKGSLLKDTGAELRKYYGDPTIPDGPERVRDAWSHIHSLIIETGANCISLYSTVGAYYGNTKAVTNLGLLNVGAQEWNKLEYYFPGDKIIDWIGIRTDEDEQSAGASNPDLAEVIGPFIMQARISPWNTTPILLCDLAPAWRVNPLLEANWLTSCLKGLLPASYSDIKAVFINYPTKLTLWSPEAFAAFRKDVSSNSYYQPKLEKSLCLH